MTSTPRIALVHDWLTGMRGGEKVLEALCELYPDARLYTLLHVPGRVSPPIERHGPRPSLLQCLPRIEQHYRSYLPLFPFLVEQFDFDEVDVIITERVIINILDSEDQLAALRGAVRLGALQGVVVGGSAGVLSGFTGGQAEEECGDSRHQQALHASPP